MPESITSGVVPPADLPRRFVGRTRLRPVVAAVVALVSLLASGACDLAGASDTAPQPQKGGTLYVNIAQGVDSLDPQGTYLAVAMNVLRLTTRTLTTYRASATNSDEIVPDLATDTGRASENNTVWKFTLKPNVKWQDGEAVKCSDVKLGIERNFDTTISGGVPYPQTYLKPNPQPYKGPYVDNDNDNNGKGLESIECVDDLNIVFHLTQPVSDFSYTLALTAFAPVKKGHDDHKKLAQTPYSNGPYKIASWDEKKQVMVMERNNFWTETNDQVRKAYPDRIVLTFQPDDDGIITNRLVENQGTARNEVLLDVDVAPNFLQQVINDPDLSARTISGPTGGVRYIAINTRLQPNIECRKALIYAFNKRKWRAVNGGAVTGDYATAMIPPGVSGHKQFDLYDSVNNPEGSPEKASTIMGEQGRACNATVKLAFRNSSLRRRLVATVVEAYQQAGIQVIPEPLDPATYYSTGIGDPANDYDMMLAGWIPDWASGSAVLPALFDGRQIAPLDPTGHGHNNNDYALLNDPKINQQIDAALAESDRTRQQALWGDLDQQIQALAVTIPILDERGIRITGSNVVGGYMSPAFGSPDLASIGLAHP
jgi:peptide/nickel transport system substrate-binding protein